MLRSWMHGDGGPTAAALDEAFSLLYGAALGLAVGSALVAFAARRRAVEELVGIALLAAVLLIPAILLGAAVGAAMAGYGRVGQRWRSR